MGWLSYSAQASLENVRIPLPKQMRSDNRDFERQQKLANLVTEQYNAYRGNYAGNIQFDMDNGSKHNCMETELTSCQSFLESF